MPAFRIFSRIAELLDIKVTRAAAAWLRLNTDGSVSQRTASETRTDLGLGTAATTNTGTGATNTILGNDARLTDARTPTSHTHVSTDVTDASAGFNGTPDSGKVMKFGVSGGIAALSDTATTGITGANASTGFGIYGASVSGAAVVGFSTSTGVAGQFNSTSGIHLNAGSGKLIVENDGTITATGSFTSSNLSGTNTGDDSPNSLYSGLVTNATHTGDATGATALTVVRIQGVDIPAPVAGDTLKYIRYNHATGDFEYETPAGGSAPATVEKDFGASLVDSGEFSITGLSGLTIGEPVMIQQANGPYTSKGTLTDDSQMDCIMVTAYAFDATTIKANWCAVTGPVSGNFKFNYKL